MSYISFQSILDKKLKEKPQYLDFISLEKEGIRIRVYGVLHALSGGINQEYVKTVNTTIEKEKELGVKVLSEKSMKKMYKGIDVEVEDWLQMSIKEFLVLGFKIIAPHNLLNIIYSFIKEKLTTKDSFSLESPNIRNIGGSMVFHAIEPSERRLLAGFPTPEEYLKKNIERKDNVLKYPGPVFPATGWSWLTLVEPFVNIPLRSIHMFEYTMEYAKRNNLKEVALFVGEIHNSDMQWYANEFDEERFTAKEIKKIKESQEIAKIPFTKSLLKYRMKYFLSTMTGVALMIWLYLLIIHLVRAW